MTTAMARRDMTAPRLDYLTLATVGSQVWLDGRWLTIVDLLDCHRHGPDARCVPVAFDDRVVRHFDLRRELRIRHPAAAR